MLAYLIAASVNLVTVIEVLAVIALLAFIFYLVRGRL
jgi:hypothetical protein